MLRGKCVHRIPSTNKDLIRVIYIVQRLNSLKHIWTLFKVNNDRSLTVIRFLNIVFFTYSTNEKACMFTKTFSCRCTIRCTMFVF